MNWDINKATVDAATATETLVVINKELSALFQEQELIKAEQEILDKRSAELRRKEKEVMDMLLLAGLNKFVGVDCECLVAEDPGITSPKTPEQWAAAKHFMDARAPGSFDALATIHASTFKAVIRKEISNAEANGEQIDLSWLPPFNPRQYLKIKPRKQ